MSVRIGKDLPLLKCQIQDDRAGWQGRDKFSFLASITTKAVGASLGSPTLDRTSVKK